MGQRILVNMYALHFSEYHVHRSYRCTPWKACGAYIFAFEVNWGFFNHRTRRFETDPFLDSGKFKFINLRGNRHGGSIHCVPQLVCRHIPHKPSCLLSIDHTVFSFSPNVLIRRKHNHRGIKCQVLPLTERCKITLLIGVHRRKPPYRARYSTALKWVMRQAMIVYPWAIVHFPFSVSRPYHEARLARYSHWFVSTN